MTNRFPSVTIVVNTMKNIKFVFNSQTQQIPKPLAHDPDDVPPLVMHSELKLKVSAIQSVTVTTLY